MEARSIGDSPAIKKAKAYVVSLVNPKLSEYRHAFILAVVIGALVFGIVIMTTFLLMQDCETVGSLMPMHVIEGDSYTCDSVQTSWLNPARGDFAGGFGAGENVFMTSFESINGTFDQNSMSMGFDCDVLQPTPKSGLPSWANKAGEAWYDFPCAGCGCTGTGDYSCEYTDSQDNHLKCCKGGGGECFQCDTGPALNDKPLDGCNGEITPETASKFEGRAGLRYTSADACVLAGFSKATFPDKKHWDYTYKLSRTVGGYDYTVRLNVIQQPTTYHNPATANLRPMKVSATSGAWIGSASCCKSLHGGSGHANCMNARTEYYNQIPTNEAGPQMWDMLSVLMSAQRDEAFPQISSDFFKRNALYCTKEVCPSPFEAFGIALGYSVYVEFLFTALVLFIYMAATGRWGRPALQQLLKTLETDELKEKAKEDAGSAASAAAEDVIDEHPVISL